MGILARHDSRHYSFGLDFSTPPLVFRSPRHFSVITDVFQSSTVLARCDATRIDSTRSDPHTFDRLSLDARAATRLDCNFPPPFLPFHPFLRLVFSLSISTPPLYPFLLRAAHAHAPFDPPTYTTASSIPRYLFPTRRLARFFSFSFVFARAPFRDHTRCV